MTIRERLANWISGGALMEAQRQEDAWFRIAMNAQKWQQESNEGWLIAIDRLIALQDIIACETPSANATVRRMARIARDALK